MTYEPSGWSLKALLPAHEGETFEQLLDDLERKVQQVEASREQLSPEIGADEFLALMRLLEEISGAAHRVTSYARLWFAADTQSQEALALLGRVEQLSTDVENRLLFFTLWWKGLDDEPAERLIAVSGDYAYHLESERKLKPYTLSEAEEKVINLKDVNGVDALVNLYDMITNRFSFELEVDGEVKQMTRAELTAYARSPSAELRAAAYQELYRVYGDQGNLLSQIYAHCVRDWANENLSLRGFAAPIAPRNLRNDIPDPVTDTLLDVCRRNMTVFQRFFRWKAQRLGMERLRRYDVYAPVREAERTYPYDQAVDMVIENFRAFSPLLANHATRVFAEQQIDAEIRPGKRGGAFCASVLPGLTPWVLVNYVGKVDDVLTLAHEMGHAVHAMMAEEHSLFTFHSALPMAETASVFSEVMLANRWLEQDPDPDVRRDLLVTLLNDAYATVARQAYFVLFEREAHRHAVEGATADQLCELYMDNLREQFGDAVELSDEFRWEWVSIPHIYQVPFYCYAYSFGHLLVLALYQQYREQGEAFVPRMLKILAYGGSASPDHIIREAGFDMASPEFWQSGFDVLQGMLDELEAL